MKEKELTSKELLVQKLGMEFDEVAPIFSEETLTSMTMSHVVGGAGETNPGVYSHQVLITMRQRFNQGMKSLITLAFCQKMKITLQSKFLVG